MTRHWHEREFTVHYRERRRSPLISMLKNLGRRIGRRGSYLLFLAMLDILYGYSLIITDRYGASRTKIDLLLSNKTWSVIWVVVGLICLWQAFVKLDRLAFIAEVNIMTTWGLIMFWSWAFTPTDPYGWISGTIFGGFAMLSAIVSFWPEQRPWKAGDIDG